MDGYLLGGFGLLVLTQIVALIKVTSGLKAHQTNTERRVDELERIHPRKSNPGLLHRTDVLRDGWLDEAAHREAGHIE